MALITLPFILGALTTGDNPASDIDQNFAAILAQVNGNLSVVNVPTLGGKEPALGNPAADGYILISTAAGVRSWTPPPSFSGGFSNEQVFTASGTWTRPAGITVVRIRAWGGGGANNGAGGGYGEGIFSGINGNLTITIGAGGTGGGAGGNTIVQGGNLPVVLQANGGGGSSPVTGGGFQGFGTSNVSFGIPAEGGVAGGGGSPNGGLAGAAVPGAGGSTSQNGGAGMVIIEF